MMQFEEKGETLKDKSRCANIRADLKQYKRTPRECLRSQDGTVPDECFALRNTFFECKHSIIDGRRRFRGPKGY
ncbi:PREDICTED: cytochrome c oxidase assembly factor 5 [Wasmannia auropunctata]|uniref:cytochrome c oxidase assembly factor 5 n=1 Tax=Wasmannia auropunctata TaxID=64793 RepID=UPI0005F04BEF|nr:PREDICTED: cytochrome c oxidase assembly factor 5 [Wasmannia auropunctata]